MKKAELLQKLEDFKNDGFVDMDSIIQALGNWMSASELEEFVEFVGNEYINY
jgi:hypothetical protein